MELVQRRATPADLPGMEAVKRDAGLAAWPHILPASLLATLPFPDRWAAAIGSADPRVAVLVAESSGEVVGFAITCPSGDTDAAPGTGELDGFYTSPAVWGLGVGRQLLATAVSELTDAGFRDATLWTATLNHRPRRVYAAAAWQTDGAERSRRLDGTEFVEVRYRKALGERDEKM